MGRCYMLDKLLGLLTCLLAAHLLMCYVLVGSNRLLAALLLALQCIVLGCLRTSHSKRIPRTAWVGT